MRSSNPVMSSLTENSSRQNSGYEDVSTRPMTVDDVVTKTGITLGVIIVAAAINFALGMLVSPGIAMALTLVGGIGGFITVLVASFGKKWGSAAVTLIYAVFEGLFVGGFSLMFSNVNFQGEGGMAIIGQAIVGTIGVFIGMLIVYKTGAVKVTPKFTKILFGLIAGVAVMALVNFLGAIFFDFNPLRDGGPIAIIFSLVCIVLGALSFLTDFDQADRMIRAGAPAKNAWGVALGLAVTLVWLYTEILRLLSYFQRD
ncbi:Bax inhibitor-1/YccA family protein [Corynebacterium tuberculostearicum]|uniref:Bax inhibitor-1/YccA family protein n=3 Tax=Corynebacterium TaxID=1716 RepID=A0A7U0H802_9CORY|nr:Bax inhibitor-1/YccA family protein [Corynebacterium tuberculostearicum]QQA99680.1 Bax inhibitor-1/YccA family protein [Corynebacterium tuberculostearicum]QQU81416.1 Bax inhibitor-1/YccA family protein [Corynebacterium tuberculostearicum]